MLGLDAARSAVDREVTAMLALLEEAGPQDWGRETGLPGWSVGDLAAHLVWGQSLQADGWAKVLAGSTEPAEGEVLTGSPEQVRTALAERAARFRGTLARVGEEHLDRSYAMPYGTLPARFVLQVAVMEAGVHHHDLAGSLLRPTGLAPDVTSATLWLLPFVLPSMAAAATERPPVGTAVRLQGATAAVTLRVEDAGWVAAPEAEATCTVSGDDVAVALFALGRLPTVPLEVRGEWSLADRFKVLFPGP